jgi:tRNA nucleotidyltransferase (CCA-adding enzyme)
MDIITTHINADFDALASVIAAKKLYPEALIVFPGSLEKKVRDFIDAFNPVEITKIKDVHMDEVNRLIIVDTKNPSRIGEFSKLLSKKNIKVHIYDHHPVGADDIRGEVEIIDKTGSLSAMFVEMLQKKKALMTPLEATAMCLGIYEETGSLTYNSTTPRDLTAAAYLLKRGANLKIVSGFLKEQLSTEDFSLLSDIVNSLRETVVEGIRIKIGKAVSEGFSDVAHLAHKVMEMEDADAVILLIRMADKIVIVGRSRASELDMAKVLSAFGGGGHPPAASATIKDMPFELIEGKLNEEIHSNVKPKKTARDVMTTPVVTIQWNSAIKDAQEMMTRYGVNVLPVLKKDKYIGILSREIVEKALFHSLGKNKCSDFASTDAITASADCPVAVVEKAMIEQNQRFVAVVEGEKIIGAITRTDILRSLYEDFLKKSRIQARETTEPSSSITRQVIGILRDKLPRDLYEFLIKSGEIADKLGMNAYMVGGCVRDMLRGEENLDIDIVIEGDGIVFAKKLADMMQSKVTIYKRFGTAHIIIPKNYPLKVQGSKIDIATARTEYYESPAALPTVETSSIKKDLYRRDFTINTLAVKLNKKDFGTLIDFFGGQRDLKDKVIRSLHNLSFVEDPTRAFRAVRFAERFNFKITKHTENLIKLAIRMDIFDKLSGTRIYDELMLTFQETNPVNTIKRLADYGLLKVIHPNLIFSAGLETLLQSVHDTVTWFDLLFLEERFDRGLIYIMALLHGLSREDRNAALERLKVPILPKERIISGIEAANDILRKLTADNPAATYHLLHGKDIMQTLMGMALAGDSDKKKAVSHYLLELRRVRPALRGDDLKKLGIPPGPVYSEIFAKIVNEKLMKRLQTKEEEIEFVKSMSG